MIPRYKVKEISDIWSTNNKLNTWLKVEIAHLKSLYGNLTNKTISKEELDVILCNIRIDKDRWIEIEKETRHDLQAFVQMLEESVPGNEGRWIHYGLTSSDILDTSLSLMCRDSLSVIINHAAMIIHSLNKLLYCEESKSNILSRTHGKAAEVQTYQDIFSRWLSQIRRAYDELCIAKGKISHGKLSGPSGNYTTNSIENEKQALDTLGLESIVSSQIISRDIYLDYFYSILKLVLAIEKIAFDIRVYSIDGVNEMAEPFRKGQKGSSSMPHKKNPIITENICGLSRLYKSYFQTAIDNCMTLLERDISHSSSERIIFKDSAHIACYITSKCNEVLTNLQLLKDTAALNISKFENKISSQEDMNKMIKSGKSRKESHDNSQLNNS